MKLENYIVENWANDSPYMSRGLKSFAFSPLTLLVIDRKNTWLIKILIHKSNRL